MNLNFAVKTNISKYMKIRLLILISLLTTFADTMAMKHRGVVYDVGLQYNSGEYSVENFNADLVRYDMKVIADSLHCNAVRIEGEDISRLEQASLLAAEVGLKVFFNPWWMNADADQVATYMIRAAKTEEQLRKRGVDITFVTGCEFSLFNNGIIEGKNIGERIASLMKLQELQDKPAELKKATDMITTELNTALGKIVKGIRKHFNGAVTYSAGTWEQVDWSMFDIIGVDYYRDRQSDEEYLAGIKEYLRYGKPVWVMEVGCCTFEGASKLGGGGFTVLHGVDENGCGIYAGGSAPARSEKEQADYDEQQIRLLSDSGIDGLFIFVFSFPIAPYREIGLDYDLTAYPIVKSFPKDDPRSRQMPPWQPKEAFHRIGAVYHELQQME